MQAGGGGGGAALHEVYMPNAQPLLGAKITHVNTTHNYYKFTVLSLLTLSKPLRDLERITYKIGELKFKWTCGLKAEAES